MRFADTTITEITCHAQGVHHLAPEARTIIEIGGQDSKFITLEERRPRAGLRHERPLRGGQWPVS